MIDQVIIRNILLILCFGIMVILFIIKKQDEKLNWSIFFSVLWVTFSLGTINYICVNNEYWRFLSETSLAIKIPFDLFFVWIVFWGIIPFYIFRGKYTLVLTLLLFWVDIILIPELEKLNLLQLNDNWLIGESFLILFVWLPSYFWAKFYYCKTHLKFRSLFQVLVMFALLFLVIPFTVIIYTSSQFQLPKLNPYIFQIILIIAFPSLCAVNELAIKGKGTPFPYDKTKFLVETGVYAYCKNPIQWSFTLLFIPLSIYYESYLLLSGLIISIAYTIGISNPQEYEDMNNRFKGNWLEYKKNVPSWMFLWKPKHIPKGNIYFKMNCNQCEQIKRWFSKHNAINLEVNYSTQNKGASFLQVTYIDYYGTEFKSIKAIAYAFEHINLGYACLGWFMRFPLISKLLQSIINTMDFNVNEKSSDLNNY